MRAASVFLFTFTVHIILPPCLFVTSLNPPSRFFHSNHPPPTPTPSCSFPLRSALVSLPLKFSACQAALHPAWRLLSLYLFSSWIHHSCCLPCPQPLTLAPWKDCRQDHFLPGKPTLPDSSTRADTFLNSSWDFYFPPLLPLNLFFSTSLPYPHTAGSLPWLAVFLLKSPGTHPHPLLTQTSSNIARMWYCGSGFCWDPWRLSAKELMLSNGGAGEDSWESLGLQGDQTSQS